MLKRFFLNVSTALYITGISALAAPDAGNQSVTAPVIHQVPAKWPWGAQVDESAFAPGGKGKTIVAATDGKPGAAGTLEDPLDLPSACARVAKIMRCFDIGAARLPKPVTYPCWVRLSRAGKVFTSQTAPDENGKPGEWTSVGSPRQAELPARLQVGFIATSGQLWPKAGQAAQAVIDHIQITPSEGHRFDARKFGNDRGKNSGVTSAEDGSVTLRGNGEHWRERQRDGSYDMITNGCGYVTEIEGDFILTARVRSLEELESVGSAYLRLVARDGLGMKARQLGLELGGAVSQKNLNSVSQVWRISAVERGTPGRLLLKEGTYRDPIAWPERDEEARKLTLVIEGEKLNGKTGQVIFSGAAATGFEPSTWNRRADGAWTHPWSQTWGGKEVKERQETIAIIPSGGTGRRLRVVFPDFKGEAGTFTVDESARQLILSLPDGLDANAFMRSRVLVAVRNKALLGYGTPNNQLDIGENVVLRNLVFESVGGNVAVQIQDWMQPIEAARNILLEDLSFRWNAGQSFIIDHLRDFTLRRVVCDDNGDGSWLMASEGRIEDCVWNGNDRLRSSGIFWNAMRNVLATGCQFIGNRGGAWRMDHVGENVVVDSCRFEKNEGMTTMVWETDMGSTMIRNCDFLGNRSTNSGVLGLSTVHNFTIEHCRFTDNLPAAISLYPRSRAHTAVKRHDDELCNNFDRMAWDTRNTTEGRWGPGGKKPAAFNRNLIIHDCIFGAADPKAMFITQERYKRPDAYYRTIHEELAAWNNAYWNPQNPKPFLGAKEVSGEDPSKGLAYPDTPIDFGAWKAQSAWPGFEAGSVWGEKVTNPVRPAIPETAVPGSNPQPKAVDGSFVYEVVALPFQATKAVLLWKHEGRVFHHLQADQVGEYGDRIDYEIEVPQAGTYTLTMRYLQNATPFHYLGFAQLLLDGKRIGPPIDQSGLTTRVATTPIDNLTLAAGRHRLTVAAVWRNGYTSGDYDLTIGGFTLWSKTPLRQAATVRGTKPGLSLVTVGGIRSRTLKGIDWKRAEPGQPQAEPSIAVSTPGAQRMEGFLDIPADGIWQLALEVVGGANLYLDGELLIDCDGQHWGEKDEAWRKTVPAALAKGPHRLRIDALAQSHKPSLKLVWAGPDTPSAPVPAAAFSHGGQADKSGELK